MSISTELSSLIQSARNLENDHEQAVLDVKKSTNKINIIKLEWLDLRDFIWLYHPNDRNTYENRKQDDLRRLNQEISVYDEAFERMVDRSHRKHTAWNLVEERRELERRCPVASMN